MKKTILFTLLTLCFSVNINAQRIVYTNHTKNSSRILETNLKKVTRFGDKSRKFYMWAGLTSLDFKGVAIYSLKVMFTSEYRLTIEQGAPLVLTMNNGEDITLKSAVKAESKHLDGVETVFGTYEIKESELQAIAKNGVTKVAPTITCFGKSDYEENINMWKLARPLSLRYQLLKEYIKNNPE